VDILLFSKDQTRFGYYLTTISKYCFRATPNEGRNTTGTSDVT